MMMESLRYFGLALAFGAIATFASENLFWIVPPPGITVADWLMTWGAYSVACAAVLTTAILTGAGGWRAAFLGGALMGYLVEGVAVGTIYDAFPVQLVWTPLAWHGIVSGLAFVALPRAALPPRRAVTLWVAVAAGLTLWALYWPLERRDLPGTSGLLVYLGLPGLGAVAAHLLIDRWGTPRPPRAVLWIAPGIVAAVFAAQSVAAPDPRRIALPVIVGGLVLLMRRARGGGWGRAQPPLFLIVPLTVALAAPPLWAVYGAVATNIPIALLTSHAGCGLVAFLALRRP